MAQITTNNPATREDIETYDLMSKDEAFSKIDAAHEAFQEWRTRSHEDRGEILRKIAKTLRDNTDRISELMTKETGKLLKDGKTEVEICARIFEYSADRGPEELADEEREHSGGKKKGIVTYSPIGVIYSIQPWNFPLYQPVRVLAANAMAGNACLLKHASICTGSGLLLRDLCLEAGLPKGLFDVVLVDHDTSDQIIEHDKVRAVTMTGSDDAGRHIGSKAAKALKKTVLELGSNDAYLVLEDADLAKAADVCAQARLYNNGQTCINGKRFIVTDKVYDAFLEKFVGRFEGVKLGDPTDKDSDMGPMSSADLRDDLQKQVDESVSKGAKIACGGKIPDGPGAFYPATVLTDVAPGQPAYDDELFGPVASVIRAKDDEDAMRLANDSRYGLGGGILCGDTDRAIELASKHFDTGMVYINTYGVADPSMPFGGVKNSGYGREHGGFGMKEFVNAKSIFLPS